MSIKCDHGLLGDSGDDCTVLVSGTFAGNPDQGRGADDIGLVDAIVFVTDALWLAYAGSVHVGGHSMRDPVI